MAVRVMEMEGSRSTVLARSKAKSGLRLGLSERKGGRGAAARGEFLRGEGFLRK